jgi:tetratricopeptide (TPR) repeat protein
VVAAAEAPAAADPADPLAALDGERQVIATTVFDRDSSAAVAARLARQLAPEECLPDTALDVGRWTNGTPLHHQVPELQRLVVGEFDRPNPVAVRDLARLYLRFGFGAEAEDMIESFGADFPERALLTDLARVIERRPLAGGGPLSLRTACPGRHGLWLAIAGQPAALADPRLFGTVQTAFEDMPPDLRRLVAPPLVEGLLDNGRVAEAGLMFDIADRAGVAADPDLRLAAARLAAVQGRTPEGEAALAGLIAENAWNATEALQHLVRIRMDRGAEVPQPWLTDLAAAALEQRGAPREWDLRALRAEALARNGALGGALDEVVALRQDLPARAAAAEELAVRLMARADPARTGGAAYAEAILSHERMIGPAPVNDPPRIAIAGRMTDLGLPNAALGLLEPAVDREVAAARLLAARVYVGMGRPDPALALLRALPGDDAGRLRARAHAQRGEYDLALAEMSAAAPAEEALAYAWASGAWDRVAAGAEDPERLAMAAFMQSRGDDVTAAAPPPGLDPASPAAAFRAPLPNLESPSLRAARELLDTGRQVGGLVQGLLGTPVTATP